MLTKIKKLSVQVQKFKQLFEFSCVSEKKIVLLCVIIGKKILPCQLIAINWANPGRRIKKSLKMWKLLELRIFLLRNGCNNYIWISRNSKDYDIKRLIETFRCINSLEVRVEFMRPEISNLASPSNKMIQLNLRY